MPTDKCFWPDGSYASGYATCGSKDTTSHCCFETDYCLGNKLCFDQAHSLVYRGACTSSPWHIDTCGRNCLEFAHDNANGVLACLDEKGWWGGMFICFGSDCANDSASFELEPGPVLVNDALRSDLPASSYTANIAPLGIGLGFGLGIPLVAALAGSFYLCTRLRQQSRPPLQSDAAKGGMYTRPKSAFMAPDPTTLIASNPRSFQPVESISMPYQSTAVPELGDTSTLTTRSP